MIAASPRIHFRIGAFLCRVSAPLPPPLFEGLGLLRFDLPPRGGRDLESDGGGGAGAGEPWVSRVSGIAVVDPRGSLP